MASIIKLHGGLGNQLFQYSFGLFLCKKYGFKIEFDNSEYEKNKLRELEILKFNVEINFCDKLKSQKYIKINSATLNNLLQKFLFFRKNYFTDRLENFNDLANNAENFFWGYWQYVDFYDDILPDLRAKFVPNTFLSNEYFNFDNLIKNTQSVSIHIRKSDYLLKKNNYFASCEANYYETAIKHIKNKIFNPIFFIFSDDFEWIQSNMNLIGSDFISVRTNSENSVIEDFVLMSHCKHNIIANSTYSWWAAYLNSNEDKIVICPERWFNNSHKTLNRYEWIKVKNE